MSHNFDPSVNLKLTYHDGDKKWNTYVPSSSLYLIYNQLKEFIDNFVFETSMKPRNVLRYYWIDDEGDEIDIRDQGGLCIFVSKNQKKPHLHVAAVEEQQKPEKESVKVEAKYVDSSPKNVKTTPSIPDDDPSNFSIHDGVECDSCGVAPIVGFRYKCIQCPNYDLCQRCEWQHKHREHMMVRMPHANCPSVVEAWISGRYGRRGHGAHKRSMRGTCPFMPPPTGTAGCTTSAETRNAPGTSKPESSHRHSRRQMRNGVFSHLYEMMQGLAEGGAAVATESEEEAGAASSKAREAADEAVKAAETAACKATEAATKAAEAAAAQVAHNIASACAAGAANAAFKLSPPPTAPEESENNVNEPKVESREASNNNSVPGVESPSLESIAQFIDPQYMKAGLQILNNFSEMFAKMLDPAEGACGNSPFQGEGYQARKTSTDSAATTTSHKSTQQPQQQQNCENKSNIETAAATSTTSLNESPIAATPIKDAQTPDRRRSQSEDNGWQLIDQHSTCSNEDLSNEKAKSGAAAATASAATSTTTTNNADGAAAIAAATSMNYEQLSQTLKAHVEEEQKREQLAKEQTTQTPTVTPAATAPVEETNNNNMPTNCEPTPAPVPRARTPEEKRAVPVYHTDQRINNAVHAMMAMGFSNEGAWLTQLLESVNGNIAEALDLMSTAQRSNH